MAPLWEERKEPNMTNNDTVVAIDIEKLKDVMREVIHEENGDTETIVKRLMEGVKDTGEEWGKEKTLDFLYESGKEVLVKDLNEWLTETVRLLIGGIVVNLSLLFGYLALAIITLVVFYLLRRYHMRLSPKFATMGIVSFVLLFLLKC